MLLSGLFLLVHRTLNRIHKKELYGREGKRPFGKPFKLAAAGVAAVLVSGFYFTGVLDRHETREYANYLQAVAAAYAGALETMHSEAAGISALSAALPPSSRREMLRRWMEEQNLIEGIDLLRKDPVTGLWYYAAAAEAGGGGTEAGGVLLPAAFPPELEQAFRGAPSAQYAPTDSGEGLLLSAYAPVKGGSAVESVVRVKMKWNDILKDIRNERRTAMALVLIPYGVIVIAYWIFVRSRLERRILQYKRQELTTEQERFRVLSDSGVEGLLIHVDGTIAEVNRALCEMLGYDAAELVGSPVRQYLSREQLDTARGFFNSKSTGTYRVRALQRSGRFIDLEVHVINCSYGGRAARAVALRDITEQKRQEETIYRLAYYDELTGLPNKKRFHRSLTARLSPGSGVKSLMIVFMDLDHFKPVNDSFGHTVGDEAMRECARRLQEALPPGGRLARWGGDEFIAMIPDVADKTQAKEIGRRFMDALDKPVYCGGIPVKIGTSVGVSLYPEDGLDQETLIRKADTAMHIGKKLRNSSVHFFDTSLHEKAENRIRMEQDIRTALKEGQFVLHYQPQVWMETGDIRGVEALIRWVHPVRGQVPPSEFIPLAEESGLILEVGEWVLRQACLDMKQLQEAGLPPLCISINLSAMQFGKEDLTEKIREILAETGLPPKQLELEITETMMMDPLHALGILQQLKALGVRISIDDFGTGYSSLHYINRFPIDKLKIDRSFITDLDSSGAPITNAIISLARTMELEIIAEGVETALQAECLQRLGCPLAQGYLYYKPMPKEKLLAAITRRMAG